MEGEEEKVPPERESDGVLNEFCIKIREMYLVSKSPHVQINYPQLFQFFYADQQIVFIGHQFSHAHARLNEKIKKPSEFLCQSESKVLSCSIRVKGLEKEVA